MTTTKTSAETLVSGLRKESGLAAADDLIIVDIDAQTLVYHKDGKIAMSCKASTSRYGVGNKAGSNMTPTGLHRVEEKIGGGALPWTIFRARENTGEIWREGMDDENQILTRILRLRGLEPGVNAGEGIDSYDRYIYIHGTNHEELLGTPMSHGCVCLSNEDIITLYNMVETGTVVYIKTLKSFYEDGGYPRNAPPKTDNAKTNILKPNCGGKNFHKENFLTLTAKSTSTETSTPTSIHFVGIFGSGMSAIAQYLAASNMRITGSDRLLDAADSARVKKHLLDCGCEIFPQDGSGVTGGTGAVCVSTAIEESNPDIAAARGLGLPILHRSDVLASIVKERKTIAVAGTSGKSTVTAMIFELLTACGKSPSLISGAALRSLEEKGMLGNAFGGESDILVIEADESDGTLVKYEPYASVILNISKDHKPEEEVMAMFAQLVKQSQWSAVNADDAKLTRGLCKTITAANVDSDVVVDVDLDIDVDVNSPPWRGAPAGGGVVPRSGEETVPAITTFGFANHADFKGAITDISPLSSTIRINDTDYTLPVPGAHNASNLLAALCVCKHLGCDDADLSRAAANYRGVDRRFAIHRTASGVTVIDDFAHNPEKIRAAVDAAKNMSDKLIAVYQPHGFGPTRFLKDEYARTFKEVLRPTDALCLLPIYYAGGTAVKDIASQDIIDLMGSVPFDAAAVETRDDAIEVIKRHAPGGCVLIMGARDPSLSSFVRRVAENC